MMEFNTYQMWEQKNLKINPWMRRRGAPRMKRFLVVTHPRTWRACFRPLSHPRGSSSGLLGVSSSPLGGIPTTSKADSREGCQETKRRPLERGWQRFSEQKRAAGIGVGKEIGSGKPGEVPH